MFLLVVSTPEVKDPEPQVVQSTENRIALYWVIFFSISSLLNLVKVPKFVELGFIFLVVSVAQVLMAVGLWGYLTVLSNNWRCIDKLNIVCVIKLKRYIHCFKGCVSKNNMVLFLVKVHLQIFCYRGVWSNYDVF